MLGGALEARRGRGEHTAKGARRPERQLTIGLGQVAMDCAWWFVAYDGFGVHQKMPKAVAALHPQVMAQCLRHTLRQRSGSSQRRNKIEELGLCEGKVEGAREQTQHVCRDHQ